VQRINAASACAIGLAYQWRSAALEVSGWLRVAACLALHGLDRKYRRRRSQQWRNVKEIIERRKKMKYE